MKKPAEVIMVDDDPEDIEIMREAFTTIGQEALFKAFVTGQALVDYLDSQQDARHPTVVVLDHHLPGTTGEEILERLGAHPRMACLTFVSLSSFLGPAQQSRLKERGAVCCLNKPSTFREYVAIARKLILADGE